MPQSIQINCTPRQSAAPRARGAAPRRDGEAQICTDIIERREAEAALLASHKLLEMTERIAHIGGFGWDIASGRIVWSEEIYRMFGLVPGQFVPTLASFAECIHPDDRERVRDAIEASVSRDAPFEVEFRIMRPDGAERIIHSRGEMIRDAAGKPLRMTGTSHDVTEARRAEQKIQEEEAKFRSLVEQNVAGIFIVREDGTIGYVNPFFASLLGYAASDTIGHPLLEFIPEDAQADARDKLGAQLAGDLGFVQQNSSVRTKDGRTVEVLVNASRSIFEGRPVSLAVIIDITERNKDQRELAFNAAVRATEHEASLDGILVVDAHDRIISFNRRFIEMWGISDEIVASRSDARAMQSVLGNFKDPEYFASSVKHLFEHPEEKLHDELALLDGRTIERYSAPMPRPEGGSFGRVFYFRDITERKTDEQNLAASEERFRLLIEEAPDAILVHDFDQNKFISANRAAERLFGCSREELLKHGPVHYYAAEQPDQRPVAKTFAEHNAKVLAGEELRYERHIVNALGEERLCEVTLVRLPSTDARLMRASFVDVTEQRRADLALQRLNRTLRTLSRGNEIVVRATSEAQLMNEMCRTIVETGGFRAAWIGMVQHDPAKSVTPAAWAGEIGDYLEKARITWADEPRGRGPAGRVVRTGESQMTKDFAADPRMTPWLRAARKAGIASSISLPMTNGEIFAVLTIYSGETDAFDADALKLLTELASDLAYGIRALREQAKTADAVERWRVSLEATIGAIANTVEMRDPYTAGHQQRVARLASAIARELRLPKHQIEGLYLAGIIHDVGKINIPAEILNKPGRLSPPEHQLIQGHAQAGHDIVKGIDFPWPIAEIVYQHHEQLDGSGYPRGLKGDAILPEAKILAVADVVEAMLSHRPYRPGLGLKAALAEIAKGRGKVYDPAAVDACLALFREKGFRFE